MDKDLLKKIIVIVAVLVAALIFYFAASPLHQCLKSETNQRFCYQFTSW